MTYFPLNCFALIKDFAGFDPTYRHKKIASLIRRAKITHKSGTTHTDWSEIQYNPEIKGCRRRFRFNYKNEQLPGTVRRLIISFRGRPVPQHELSLLCWGGVISRCPHLTGYVRNTYIKPHILLYSTIASGVCTATLKDLKQYCRDNKMKGFSKHNLKTIKGFILKYEFD
jgi:hypothetical protein